MAMMTTIPLEKMTREEKLQTMEAIWRDLSREDADIQSPEWHRDALEETESRLASGEEQIVDWEQAKQNLRKRFE